METIWEAARRLLQDGGRGVLALVLERDGSAPRGVGAKMLIYPDGSIFETIGGGPTEGETIRRAAQVLEAGRAEILHFDLDGANALQPEAICGGKVTICLYPLGADDLPALDGLCAAAAAREPANFLLWREGETCRSFCAAQDRIWGSEITGTLEQTLRRALDMAGIHEEPRLLYWERVSAGARVWLMGGGHVAQATAQVAAVAGFDIVVVDDRTEFANQTRFPNAQCIICQAYDELPIDHVTSSDFIVVVTRGHSNDRISLAWALKTNACYVGMIGSRSKRDLIYDALRQTGVSQAQLDWVHSPIGLPIGGRTPGEIAVSITAELVSVRAQLEQKAQGAHGS